ncbi:patatin-like phospholipase family protein [Streptomyces sp. NPDC012888]|uniref:patatin-like phospholipase family protein n=1 Tax=Streptomyces sp. NPDC012888 TaxID=3364855 RepID=UPI003683D19B
MTGTKGTALVLGGGGITGIGWECGILHGLAEAGVDLSGADLVVGTSAGSVVGAQLASGLLTPAELYERQLAGPGAEPAARLGGAVYAQYGLAMARSRDARSYRRRIGTLALGAAAGAQEDRRTVFAARLPSHAWPERRLLVTAVDAHSGDLRVFERDGGTGLVDAVTASCAVPLVWPPVAIGGRHYIDGGIRSAANADLAAGYRRVVVIAPLALGSRLLPSPRRQAEELRAAGTEVVVIHPTREARKAFGRNVLDPARRAPAARAGLAQAAAHAAEVARVWTA